MRSPWVYCGLIYHAQFESICTKTANPTTQPVGGVLLDTLAPMPIHIFGFNAKRHFTMQCLELGISILTLE